MNRVPMNLSNLQRCKKQNTQIKNTQTIKQQDNSSKLRKDIEAITDSYFNLKIEHTKKKSTTKNAKINNKSKTKTMGPQVKYCLLLIVIKLADAGKNNPINCINTSNKMCQSVSGTLALNINACGEMFTLNDNHDVESACSYMSSCTTHPKDWKCSVAGHPIDCFHCIKREHAVKFKENYESLKQAHEMMKTDTSNYKDRRNTIAEANEIIVLITSLIGVSFSLLSMLRIYKGVSIKPIIPCIILFIVSLISSINMLIDIST